MKEHSVTWSGLTLKKGLMPGLQVQGEQGGEGNKQLIQ